MVELYVSMRKIKVFIIMLIFFLIIDFLWLGVLMGGFYIEQLGSIARSLDGGFKPLIPAAVPVYLLIPLGIFYFVLPGVDKEKLTVSSLKRGAVYGLVLYGVYDLTNLSLFNNYPLLMTAVDIFWGIFLCSITSLFGAFIGSRIK